MPFQSRPSVAPRTLNRRAFVRAAALASAGVGALSAPAALLAQSRGDRPARAEGVVVLNPAGRVPVSFIIDDSTCLVNLNKFAMPQFDAAHGGRSGSYHQAWREWPDEIPDDFVRAFGTWCGEHGVKGKYSIVPYPACVGRLDRELPGWTPRELEASLELVRTLMMPNWDIHPEMVTHTRVIDTRTGHPYPERDLRHMENWEWTTGKSAEQIADYLRYALTILKHVGLPCEGVTTPGGFGNRALPELAQATLQSVRDVFGAEVPHYFRHAFDAGPESVAPRVEYAAGLEGSDPRCVVSIIACTGDWTGGWDNTEPGGADRFITADGERGRLVEIIQRGEPACLLAHWTGIYFNGRQLGFNLFKEVVRRLHARFDRLRWMKLSELARYWAAKELTRIERAEGAFVFHAPFAAPAFTVQVTSGVDAVPRFTRGGASGAVALREVDGVARLEPDTWCRAGGKLTVCLDLPKGESRLVG